MTNQSSFVIFNASAGSGKTYSLVKAYLKTLLLNPGSDYYKYLLAITFTNKAVAEMKQRIITYLRQFSYENVLDDPPEMMKSLSKECNLSLQEVHQKSEEILHHLLHNYAAFSVETIDGLNHRLIRTFARDLKIASNFEVSLEEDELLDQAVDNLMKRAGEDKQITEILVEFTLDKTDDDKSWDISKDISRAAGILFNENELPNVERLKTWSLARFNKIRSRLRTALSEVVSQLQQLAGDTLQLIDESGLEHRDFSGSYYPNYLKKVLDGTDLRFGSKWQEALRDKPLYPTRLLKEAPQSASTIDELAHQFADVFDQTKTIYFRKIFIRSLLTNLTPLSVINLVQQEIEHIKEEENIVPISEFNRLINAEIKNQPAPYIYERLGDRYRHFFIDEFQDTSSLQWENLVPLIDNSLSQEQDANRGSLLLVGDAKQAIYRWRGGLPELFIELYNCKNPFSVTDKAVKNLDTNWRSCAEIINFNNEFFTHISGYFNKKLHQELYAIGNNQKQNYREGGYVRMEFVEFERKDDAHEVYADSVSNSIKDLLSQGYQLSDICVLTRKRMEGISVGELLMEKGIRVVSSETLLLAHSPVVKFLVNILIYKSQPENDELKAEILLFLHQHYQVNEPLSDFLAAFFPGAEFDFSATLQNYGIELRLDKTQSLTLYETCEYVLIHCGLLARADAYVDGFMNLVFDFEQRQAMLKSSFADYWSGKKEKEAISIGEGVNAVRLMTIHKAKGLEFPVVLFPYADVDIYSEKMPKTWIHAESITDESEPFMINFNKDIVEFGDEGETIYNEKRATLQLDNINLLYVTLTRAVEQLHIFSKKTNPPANGELKKYSDFFISYLEFKELWNDDSKVFEFGAPPKPVSTTSTPDVKETVLEYIASPPDTHELKLATAEASLWETDASLKITAGTLLHDIMGKIKYSDDVEEVLDKFELESGMEGTEIDKLRSIILKITSHPDLAHLFRAGQKVETERDIITADGQLLRPDRINFHPNGEITLIDYKTGGASDSHIEQVETYARALRDMKLKVNNKLIIYASEDKIMINKL